MKILDYLETDTITVDLKSTGKKEAVEELCRLLANAKDIEKTGKLVEVILEREKLGSTGIGQGVAIPHAKSETVKDLMIAAGLSKRGVNFEALDGELVYIIFLLIAPPDSAGLHLKSLAKISRLLKDKFFRQALRDAQTSEEFLSVIKEEDE